jgi:hypothetical protein
MTSNIQRNLRRPSISSRLSTYAASTHSAESGRRPVDDRAAQEHMEEIEEIKRYEVRLLVPLVLLGRGKLTGTRTLQQ